jgi:DNA-directed RNA polymerase specialized sigma subunit
VRLILKTAASPASSRPDEHQDWVAGGKRPGDLRPLLNSLQPLIQKTVNTYQKADVSEPALRAQSENQLIQGLHSYSPGKASLSTHLGWQMRGVGRFVEKHQNVARIPGSRIRFVGRFQNAKSELGDELDREPTLTEVAKRSKLTVGQAGKLQKEIRTVRLTGMMTDETGAPIGGETGDHTVNADRERLELIYYDLSTPEKQVVDLILGRGVPHPIISTNELAKKLGVSAARVSNIRASVVAKMKTLGWMR